MYKKWIDEKTITVIKENNTCNKGKKIPGKGKQYFNNLHKKTHYN